MIQEDLIPYIVGMTRQRDRVSLIFYLLSSLNKWLKSERSRFFDIHSEQFHNQETGEITRHYLLLEPLDRRNVAIAASDVEGMVAVLEMGRGSEEMFRAVPVDRNRTKRYFIPVGNKIEMKSILIVDFSQSLEENVLMLRFFVDMFTQLLETITAKDQDPLTGLSNRRSFDETISQVLDAVSCSSQDNRVKGDGACLAIFDIDHFKKVNDVFGHAIGDEVLILFARLMERVFRNGDKLFRFGGEEFLAILVEVDQEKSLQALERFRVALEEYAFPQVKRVTVSIGCIMVNQEDYPSVLIEKADQALYYSKENGRNQVNSHDLLVAEGKMTSVEHSADDIELW